MKGEITIRFWQEYPYNDMVSMPHATLEADEVYFNFLPEVGMGCCIDPDNIYYGRLLSHDEGRKAEKMPHNKITLILDVDKIHEAFRIFTAMHQLRWQMRTEKTGKDCFNATTSILAFLKAAGIIQHLIPAQYQYEDGFFRTEGMRDFFDFQVPAELNVQYFREFSLRMNKHFSPRDVLLLCQSAHNNFQKELALQKRKDFREMLCMVGAVVMPYVIFFLLSAFARWNNSLGSSGKHESNISPGAPRFG